MEIFPLSTLAVIYIKIAAEVFQEDSMVPVCSSVTTWTAHNRACKSICNGYKHYPAALTVYVNKRNEPDAIGTFEQLSSLQYISTILLLRDLFIAVQPLNLALHKSIVNLRLADIPVYLNKSNEGMLGDAQSKILHSPSSLRLRRKYSSFFSFVELECNVYLPFVDSLVAELKDTFTQLDFWLNFVVFDPHKMPEEANFLRLWNYGDR